MIPGNRDAQDYQRESSTGGKTQEGIKYSIKPGQLYGRRQYGQTDTGFVKGSKRPMHAANLSSHEISRMIHALGI